MCYHYRHLNYIENVVYLSAQLLPAQSRLSNNGCVIVFMFSFVRLSNPCFNVYSFLDFSGIFVWIYIT